jgi:hypothetical protein
MTAANCLQLTEVPSLLAQLQRERFYGRISFDLRDGEVTLFRTERTQIVSPNKTHQGVNRDGNGPRR